MDLSFFVAFHWTDWKKLVTDIHEKLGGTATVGNPNLNWSALYSESANSNIIVKYSFSCRLLLLFHVALCFILPRY